MQELEVRIIHLEPLHVASAHGFGPSPEGLAWDRIRAYVIEHSLMAQSPRFFGFNNPNPSPGSPNYGYEQWVTVAPGAGAEEGIEIKDFPGGLYAVTRSNLAEIGETWQKLVAWREAGGKYRYAHHQWLEEALDWSPDRNDEEVGLENMWFDLYMPVVG